VRPAPKPCGCGEKPGPPGVAKVSIDRGNLIRNRKYGTGLPAIVVQRDGVRQLATRVEISGEVSIVQDGSQAPAVWVETSEEVRAFMGDKPLDPI
jgi:hypothetical protein